MCTYIRTHTHTLSLSPPLPPLRMPEHHHHHHRRRQTNWQGVLTEVVNLMTANGVPQEHILHLLEELPVECHRCGGGGRGGVCMDVYIYIWMDGLAGCVFV